MISFGLFFFFMILALPAVRDGRYFILSLPLIVSIIINFTGGLA